MKTRRPSPCRPAVSPRKVFVGRRAVIGLDQMMPRSEKKRMDRHRWPHFSINTKNIWSAGNEIAVSAWVFL